MSATEAHWADFVVNGPRPAPAVDWASVDLAASHPLHPRRDARHAGHAGIIRETTDGQKSMG